MGKFAFALLLVLLTGSISAAKISGNTHDLYTLEIINNTVVEINTVPAQKIVAENGHYEFTIPGGDYSLEGLLFRNGELAMYTQENVSLVDEGSYELDLLLEPIDNSTYQAGIGDIPVDLENGQGPDVLMIIIGFSLILFLAYINYNQQLKYISHQREKRLKFLEEKTPEEPKILQNVGNALEQNTSIQAALSEESAKILDVIEKSEGRIQQKELRKIFKFSEAKMSNLLDDLEESGKIKRIRKGRGNLIRKI
ncbi:hypothetical protein HY989_05025 [Candidatus Micrarchaeota archaeon]|nr:hypothetical protein [Candidatus Micrarchaeota archaeon]